MKIFLSAIENSSLYKNGEYKHFAEFLVNEIKGKMRWNLMSYYYIKNKISLAEFIRDNSEEILIDSGAHSFQKGVKVDWEQHTEQYAKFIQHFDRKNVIGYFEMDVDNIIGYQRVKELRKRLEAVTDKIIPVWHKNRGVEDFKKMCQEHSNKIVAITGFKNEDIKDHQYLMFLKYAKQWGCKVHCLGMTRRKILDKVPFDYTDSSSWIQNSIYGRCKNGKVSRQFSKNNRDIIFLNNYIDAMKMQKEYYEKWRNQALKK